MKDMSEILNVIQSTGNTPDKLIEVLMAVQAKSEEHYISEEELYLISETLNVPPSKVYGVASFYSMLSSKKKGRYVIQVCNSGPCYVKKSSSIVSVIENHLGIRIGEMTQDGLFSLEYTSCFGACNMAPAIKINDKVYGNLTCTEIIKILESLRKEVV